ncbi:hypothetical protein DIPPA_14079 [Diplonema papillatum]|nr:hypothetical protein DIPPA_14079 [Diplonema papillatum]
MNPALIFSRRVGEASWATQRVADGVEPAQLLDDEVVVVGKHLRSFAEQLVKAPVAPGEKRRVSVVQLLSRDFIDVLADRVLAPFETDVEKRSELQSVGMPCTPSALANWTDQGSTTVVKVITGASGTPGSTPAIPRSTVVVDTMRDDVYQAVKQAVLGPAGGGPPVASGDGETDDDVYEEVALNDSSAAISRAGGVSKTSSLASVACREPVFLPLGNTRVRLTTPVGHFCEDGVAAAFKVVIGARQLLLQLEEKERSKRARKRRHPFNASSFDGAPKLAVLSDRPSPDPFAPKARLLSADAHARPRVVHLLYPGETVVGSHKGPAHVPVMLDNVLPEHVVLHCDAGTGEVVVSAPGEPVNAGGHPLIVGDAPAAPKELAAVALNGIAVPEGHWRFAGKPLRDGDLITVGECAFRFLEPKKDSGGGGLTLEEKEEVLAKRRERLASEAAELDAIDDAEESFDIVVNESFSDATSDAGHFDTGPANSNNAIELRTEILSQRLSPTLDKQNARLANEIRTMIYNQKLIECERELERLELHRPQFEVLYEFHQRGLIGWTNKGCLTANGEPASKKTHEKKAKEKLWLWLGKWEYLPAGKSGWMYAADGDADYHEVAQPTDTIRRRVWRRPRRRDLK